MSSLCVMTFSEITFYEMTLCEVTCDVRESEVSWVSWAAASLNNKNPNHKDMGKN